MNKPFKSLISLTSLAVLVLTISADAYANTSRQERRTKEQVRVCIAEIGRHADYSAASRVIHWVTARDHRPVDGMKIKVETSVFIKSEPLVLSYTASCVTDTFGDLIEFQIDQAAGL